MPESWRDILERAAKNLSIDLEREARSGFSHQLAGWPAPARPAQRHSFAESRELLARELEAIAGGPPNCHSKRTGGLITRAVRPDSVSTPPLTEAIRPPVKTAAKDAQAQPRRGRALAVFVATTVSVAVTLLTSYAFLTLMN